MSLIRWLLLAPALTLALAGPYPSRLSWGGWTGPTPYTLTYQRFQLDGGGATTRRYHVNALTRLDPNRPGILLRPVDRNNNVVTTYDQAIPLNPSPTQVDVRYQSTAVAYLKIDYTYSGVGDAEMYWDSQPLYTWYGGMAQDWRWGVLWGLTFGTVSFFWIPAGSGSYHTTLAVPLDGSLHSLYFTAGGSCFSLGGPWRGTYWINSQQMQQGKIYWVQAENHCNNPGIGGGLKQITAQAQITYTTPGLPPLVTPPAAGWGDGGIQVGRPQWAPGWRSSLTGQDAGNTGSLGRATFGGSVSVAPGGLLPVLDYYTVSRRYAITSLGFNGGDFFAAQQSQVTLFNCQSWNAQGNCANQVGQATFRAIPASQDPLQIALGGALDGRVTVSNVVSFPNGQTQTTTVLDAQPTVPVQSYTLTDTFACIAGNCP